MTVTEELHQAFLDALGTQVLDSSDRATKPLIVDLALPRPPRLRVYMYTLVGGFGTKRAFEYKAVLRVPGQRVGKYGSFDHSDGRLALVIGYRRDLDVFVLWDASLHPRFKNGGNIQVKDDFVHEAAAKGHAVQVRELKSGVNEIVFVCQSWNLADTIDRRIGWTGGVAEGEWVTSPS